MQGNALGSKPGGGGVYVGRRLSLTPTGQTTEGFHQGQNRTRYVALKVMWRPRWMTLSHQRFDRTERHITPLWLRSELLHYIRRSDDVRTSIPLSQCSSALP